MPTLSFDFASSASLTLTQTQVTGGVGKLNTAVRTNRPYSKTFTSDTGITYNPAKTEFTGSLVRQRDRADSGGTFLAMFTSSVNAEYAAGASTGTLHGSSTISGGSLVNTTASDGASYSAASSADFTQTGTIRIWLKPGYSGTPSSNQTFFAISKNINNANNIYVTHVQTSGKILIAILSDIGAGIVYGYASASAWSPVAGTTYELELNFDITAGHTRLFIDGVLFGSDQTNTGTRTTDVGTLVVGNLFDGGAGNYTEAFIGEILAVKLFSTVQHTSNFTPEAIPNYRYEQDLISSSPAPKDGLGPFIRFTAFTVVETGTVRYSLNGYYWNGSAWAVSNGTYAQMSSASDMNAHITSLDTSAMTTCYVTGMADNSNTVQSSVTSISMSYDTLGYYDNGGILFSPFYAKSISSITATEVTSPTDTQIRWGLYVNGVLKYWNGSAWASSDGSAAQLNTLATLNTNLATGVPTNCTVMLYARLDTLTYVAFTPTLDNVVITYTYGGVVSTSQTAIVWGYVKKPDGSAISGATITFTPIRASTTPFKYADSSIVVGSVSITSDALGYFMTDLIISGEFEELTDYTVTITKDSATYTGVVSVINSGGIYNLSDIIVQ